MLIYSNINKNEIYQVTKKRIEKFDFTKLKEKDSNIKMYIEEVLNNGGFVYALGKKKVLKCVYIFKLVTEENDKILVFDKSVVLEEAINCIEKFEKDIPEILGEELIDRQEIKKVVWEDKEIKPIKLIIGRYELPVTTLWIISGAILWHVTGDLFWFLIGISLGFSTGYAVKKSEEQIKHKNNEDKKIK